jgi:hypothetical protein
MSEIAEVRKGDATPTAIAGAGAGRAAEAPAATDARRGAWPLYGMIAGVASVTSTQLTSQTMGPEVKQGGVEAVYAALGDPLLLRVGACLGFLGILTLVAFSVGYLRFLESRAGEKSLWVSAMRMGFTGSIGALIVTYSLKAMLAGGMPGGLDEVLYTRTDVAVLHLLVDQLQWVGWWGVSIAMACTAGLSLQVKVLPRWIGWLSVLFVTFVFVFSLVLALPYSAGVVAGPWLLATSIGVASCRNKATA